MMTNDGLRLALSELSDSKLRELMRNQYPGLAEQLGQADRNAVQLSLVDWVDQRGDGERARLAEMIALISGQRANGKNTTTMIETPDLNVMGERLEQVSRRLDGIEKSVAGIDQNLRTVERFLSPLERFDIEDWIQVRDMIHRGSTYIGWLAVGLGLSYAAGLGVLIALVMHLVKGGG